MWQMQPLEDEAFEIETAIDSSTGVVWISIIIAVCPFQSFNFSEPIQLY